MKRSANMLTGPLWSSLITYTIPIILTSVLQLLFNAADLVIVGRYSGSINVAAVSATGSITNLIVNLFIGLSIGAGVTVAHAIGGNNHQAVHRTVHTAKAVGPGGVLAAVPDTVPFFGGIHHAVEIAVGGFYIFTLLTAQCVVQTLFKGKFF